MKYDRHNLSFAAALLSLNLLSGEDIVDISTKALSDGRQSEFFTYLSGLRNPDFSEVKSVFEKALAHMHIALPAFNDAIDLLLKHYLEMITERRLVPSAGLHYLMQNVYEKFKFYKQDKKEQGDSLGIQKLVELYYSYDDLMELCRHEAQKMEDEINEKVIRECALMLEH